MSDIRGVGVESLKAYLADNPESHVYDFSQVQAWEQCGQKYAYKYIHNIPSVQGVNAAYSSHVMHPNVALFFELGSDNYWATVGRDIKGKWWQDCYTKYRDVLESHDTILNDKEMTLFTIDSAITAMYQLNERAIDYDFRGYYRYINTETVYWRVLPNLKNAVWVSKPDVMLQRRSDDINVPVEIKLSTWNINSHALPFDRQLLSQAWTSDAGVNLRLFFWFERVYSNKKPSLKSKAKAAPLNAVDVVNDLLRPGGIRQVGSEPELTPSDIRIHVYTHSQPPDRLLLDAWLVETEAVVADMQRARETEIYPKRAPRACHDFNHACEFIDMCPLGIGAKFLVDTMPKVNPLEYLGL